METKNFSLKGQSYCGLLRCQVDTITEDKVSSLIKMDIYYLNNRTLMATILSKDPEIQSHTGKSVNVTGSMSDHHGELRMYFTETADCIDTYFICRINFFLASGQTDFTEKTTVPNSREKDGHDLYMKSQISYEQTISDESGLFLKNLNSASDFLKYRMAFSLQTGNSDTFTSEKAIELTKNSLMSQKTKHEPEIKQVLSELESRMAYMYNFSMTELLMNITNIYEHQENKNLIGIQQIVKKLQEDNNNTLLQLKNKLNNMVNKLEVCVAMKDLNQSNDDHFNMKVSLEFISKQLDGLFTSQETLRESLANLSSSVMSLNLQEKKSHLKCERGMTSSLKPREVMTINSSTKILCDTKTDGGGWIIIQDRYMLRVDMRCENVDSYAVYDYFKVEDETQQYTLRLGAYFGNATDKFSYNKDMKFSTYDKDNDGYPSINCATIEYHTSGWWFTSCSYINLNGVWGGRVSRNFIYWVQYKECTFVEMKIRKKIFGVSEF